MPRIVIALAAFAVMLSAHPARAQLCTPFTDVADSDPFCGNIQWMYNRAITFGCGSGSQYCPDQFVRRDQMAAFMNRLGNIVHQQGGNAFGLTSVLGTTDNQSLDIRVNSARAMRFEPNAISSNVIGGHVQNNVVNGVGGAFIGGGGGTGQSPNMVTSHYGSVVGGEQNQAGFRATVAGGNGNIASGNASAVAGGTNNNASNFYAFVAGGNVNHAGGVSSFAAGSFARANGDRCAVFSLWGVAPGMQCFGIQGTLAVGAPNGVALDYFSQTADGDGTRYVHIGRVNGQTIATWTGAFLSDAGVWVNASSSREGKTEFVPVDASAILDKVAALPITTWRYREGEGEVRHIGPMAEDFHAAFDVGYGPHTIADLDARGVAFAAIQGLNAKLEAASAAKDTEIAALRAELAAIRSALASIAEARPTQTAVIGP